MTLQGTCKSNRIRDNRGGYAVNFYASMIKCSVITLFFTVHTSCALAGAADCGNLENHYGPYDYRSATKETLALVEKVHFTAKVESLRGGNTSITPGGDMSYTLKVFPNHHRALMAIMNYAEKAKKDPPPESPYSVRCWFDRAERFRPDDGVVQALYGSYLIRTKNTQEGIAKLNNAVELAGDNGNVFYILGLAYYDAKEYEKSVENTHRAYQQGFVLPGLKEKLKKIGKWKDLPQQPTAE